MKKRKKKRQTKKQKVKPEKKKKTRSGKPLSEAQIDNLWSLYQSGMTVHAIAKKCKVSPVTVRKYKDKLNWSGRLAKIRQKAERIVDDSIAKRRARFIKQGQLLQARGTKFFQEFVITDERTALVAIKEGIGIEREAVGKEEVDEEIVIKLPEGYEGI